ncbi:hypothetical protein HFO09_29285 [Rhizobium laguerreae]|uniref:hypothetical protein n=1 Tax=Rhizobium laguerreae TaxID=1076926 RepID=UPI001C900243|nr:hypothetical protein [Rhizobium laguerreae]MBY3258462.1 hypothetical protein [Rhizobium laguerreae]MBY3286449.1 hypothetical protein [Rhizobium laguerreae]MBY3293112.1 hypothetical protein [Rhizobium laguerreae]
MSAKITRVVAFTSMLISLTAPFAMAQDRQGQHYDAEAGRWIANDPTAPANVDPVPPDQIPSKYNGNVQPDQGGDSGKSQKGVR